MEFFMVLLKMSSGFFYFAQPRVEGLKIEGCAVSSTVFSGIAVKRQFPVLFFHAFLVIFRSTEDLLSRLTAIG